MVEWNKNNLRLLKEFVEANKSAEFIASHFETTPVNIRMVMSRNKIRVKKNKAGAPSNFKKQKTDLATRIRILKGEEIREDAYLCEFTDEQLLEWKDNTVECCNKFVKDILNVELQDYQLECIDKMLNHKRFVGVLGRQSGKDFLLSVFVVWQSIINPNSKILLVSASQRASDLLYNRILTYIGQSKELFDSVKQSNMEKCIFRNGSEVWSLPATGQIRGQTEVTHVIVNEAFEVPNEAFSSVEPMLAVKHGYLYLFSTPRGCIGRLWDAFNDPLFAKVQLPSTVNKYIPKEYFKLQKKTMDTLEYSMEIEAQFQESLDSFFKLSTINKCTEDYDLTNTPTGTDFYCGIDWGRKSDSSVITIIQKQIEGDDFSLKIRNMIELVNTPFPAQIAIIKKLHERYSFKKIMCEYAGLGMPPTDDLMISGLPVEQFIPTLNNKEEAYNHLRKTMEDFELTIPKNHQKLQYELRTFMVEFTQTGKMKLHHLSNGSDDFCDSLMMSVWATKETGIILEFMDCERGY